MRDDWREHVDKQAVEAHNAASSHNSEQLYRGVSGALVFALVQSEQEYNAALLRHRLRRLPCESNILSSFEYKAWHQHFRDILSRLKNKKAAGED